MDRPEWIDTFPDALTVVGTLTNNANRGIAGTNPRTGQPNSPVDAPNPRGGPHPADTCRQPVRAHHPLEVQPDFTRADVLLGHLRARR